MKIKVIILIFLLSARVAVAKPKIVTSITPIASIVAMILGDGAEITTIAATTGCPHHFHTSPHGLARIQNANMVIYIDDNFDNFAAKLMKNHQVNIVRLSKLPLLKIINNNWHFWLDLDNVEILLEEFARLFTKEFPELKNLIALNIELSRTRINNLKKFKTEKLASLPQIILLSDSLEYFFLNHGAKKLFKNNHPSLKYLTELKKVTTQNKHQCLIISSEQNPDIYQHLYLPIAQLESENWTMPPDAESLNSLFYDQYIKMINQLSEYCARVQ